MTVEPGQRWRMPSGSCWQVVRFCKEDARDVVVSPVIDGVLSSETHKQEEFRCSYLSRFGVLAR
jgi:hypothetical protein